MAIGLDASAAAWIAIQGDSGDFGRVHVLDTPMLAARGIAATGGPADKRDRYNRVPNFHIMLWRKPA
ncbi:hypothetical protein [Sandarakinorhabdus sp.]|jgi:hypothetical protein|uniref:hypothetical protein n=1 Tax=Sandarakinorhabdus sp. TaxID=1916663 RepID=UPI0035682EFE